MSVEVVGASGRVGRLAGALDNFDGVRVHALVAGGGEHLLPHLAATLLTSAPIS